MSSLYYDTENRTANRTSGYYYQKTHRRKPGKFHLCALTEQTPMKPMVIIRQHNEENQGKCHLHADTKQKNRTANGTNGYEKQKKKRKEESVISMLIQITEQSMVPMVMIREDNEQKPRKVPLYSQRENSQWDQWLLSENTTEKTKENVIYMLLQNKSQWSQWL